jgi:hypothetical protein
MDICNVIIDVIIANFGFGWQEKVSELCLKDH